MVCTGGRINSHMSTVFSAPPALCRWSKRLVGWRFVLPLRYSPGGGMRFLSISQFFVWKLKKETVNRKIHPDRRRGPVDLRPDDVTAIMSYRGEPTEGLFCPDLSKPDYGGNPGLIYRFTGPQERLTWTVNAPADDNYTVSLVCFGDDDILDDCEVELQCNGIVLTRMVGARTEWDADRISAMSCRPAGFSWMGGVPAGERMHIPECHYRSRGHAGWSCESGFRVVTHYSGG